MVQSKVIILNGPPGSGKDAIAEYLSIEGTLSDKYGETFHREVKETLFKQALAISGVERGEWFERYEDRELKEMPWDKLGDLTQRQLLIKISEDWVKPIFGKDFYGLAAAKIARAHMDNDCSVAFSDGGFQEEFNSIRDEVGAENILLVRLYRGDTTFKGDSRGYLSHPRFEMELVNDSTLEEAAKRIKQRLEVGYE